MVLGVLVLAWIGVALVVSTGMLIVLAVTLSMVGAYAATRSVATASVGWVLGVVFLFLAFVALSALGIYRGVDSTGVPRDVIARNLRAFYAGGLLVFGAIAGKIVQIVGRRFPRASAAVAEG